MESCPATESFPATESATESWACEGGGPFCLGMGIEAMGTYGYRFAHGRYALLALPRS